MGTNRLFHHPPIPKPDFVRVVNCDPGSVELKDYYTLDQMIIYAKTYYDYFRELTVEIAARDRIIKSMEKEIKNIKDYLNHE